VSQCCLRQRKFAGAEAWVATVEQIDSGFPLAVPLLKSGSQGMLERHLPLENIHISDADPLLWQELFLSSGNISDSVSLNSYRQISTLTC